MKGSKLHRVSFAKKAVARLRTPCPAAAAGSPAATRTARRARRWSSPGAHPHRSRPDAPTPAPPSRSDRSPGHTCPIVRSPRRHASTMSALNSGVNDRRARGLFRSMVSMMGILSGAEPLMVDVRQTGASPRFVLFALTAPGSTGRMATSADAAVTKRSCPLAAHPSRVSRGIPHGGDAMPMSLVVHGKRGSAHEPAPSDRRG